ncbi:MAG: hypothetical protein IKU43_01160 [Clostridia bacterium]|nr:hypothetical protein [Clostridia bacterium]
MKKKFINIIPYLIGVIYLAYCLFNVESWVKSHTEKYLLFVLMAWLVAVILAVIFVALRLIKKQKTKMYLPLFFFAIGLIVYAVALSIPCCIDG